MGTSAGKLLEVWVVWEEGKASGLASGLRVAVGARKEIGTEVEAGAQKDIELFLGISGSGWIEA